MRRFDSPERPDRFSQKDGITIPLLRTVKVAFPKTFHALLMPSLYGPEVFYLRAAGVPGENIFAVERDAKVHCVLANPPAELTHLQGIKTTPEPQELNAAIEYVPDWRLNFVYIDLFGQLNASHLSALHKLFRLFPFRRHGTLLLTHGLNRGVPFACKLNKKLIEAPGKAYIRAALELAGHAHPSEVKTHRYTSDRIHYRLTEVRF